MNSIQLSDCSILLNIAKDNYSSGMYSIETML